MDEIYLTSNLVIKNNKSYYINENTNKWEKINLKNWHKYFGEYGWEKIDQGWIRRLNKYKKEYNSRWGILDCGGDGDCLFYVITEAIRLEDPNIDIDVEILRQICAEQIDENNFDMIIDIYRIMYDVGDFLGDWNPHEISCIDDLKKEIKKTGHNHWGDHIIIQLLGRALDINFIILNSEKVDDNDNKIKGNLKERFNIHSIGSDYITTQKTIIIYYIDSMHFKLVGYFNDNYVQTLFDEIPEELMIIYRDDIHMLK